MWKRISKRIYWEIGHAFSLLLSENSFSIGSELITHSSVIVASLMTFSTRQLLLVKDNANNTLYDNEFMSVVLERGDDDGFGRP